MTQRQPGGQHCLYVGPLWTGSTALHRMRALQDNEIVVAAIDTTPAFLAGAARRLARRAWRRMVGPQDEAGANSAILEHARRLPPDILWVDKGLTITAETLRLVAEAAPRCARVGYSPDDIMNPINRTKGYVKSLAEYDVYFTTKSFGVEELKSLGAPRVHFIDNAYDPYTHRPVRLSKPLRQRLGGQVGFVGEWESQRADAICSLASTGIDVRVWGAGWHRTSVSRAGVKAEGIGLWGDLYAAAICSFDINLCFLRKANRDRQTQRSVEIPACGGFMLAERTDEHARLFHEDREAVFFSSIDEMIEKARHYLAHPEQRAAIARAGYERCIADGYANRDRCGEMLSLIGRLRSEIQESRLNARCRAE